MPELTRKELDLWVKLEKRRKSLARQAKAIREQQEPTEAKALAYVRKHGGKAGVAFCCGFRLVKTLLANGVKWKNEFVRVAGLAKAEKLTAAAGTYEEVTIEPPRS